MFDLMILSREDATEAQRRLWSCASLIYVHPVRKSGWVNQIHVCSDSIITKLSFESKQYSV